jgi:hypothetical protein
MDILVNAIAAHNRRKEHFLDVEQNALRDRDRRLAHEIAEVLRLGSAVPHPVNGEVKINEDRFRFTDETQRYAGVVYVCNACGNEHVYPVKELADYGEFIVDRERVTKLCGDMSHERESPTEALLTKILTELQQINTKLAGK